jgi:hypothetical protein
MYIRGTNDIVYIFTTSTTRFRVFTQTYAEVKLS